MNFVVNSIAAPVVAEPSLLKTLLPTFVTAFVGLIAVVVSLIGVRASKANLLRQLTWQRLEARRAVFREKIAIFLSLTADIYFAMLHRHELIELKKVTPNDPDITQQLASVENKINEQISSFDQLFNVILLALDESNPAERDIEELMTKLYRVVRDIQNPFGRSKEISDLKNQIFEKTRIALKPC